MAPDGSWLASASYDMTVRIWDPHSGQAVHTLTGHTGGVGALAVAQDGSWLASASTDRTVRIWESGADRCVTSLRTGHPLWLVVIDGERVTVAGVNGPYFLTVAGR